MKVNQQVRLTPRLSVSNEIANLPVLESWTKQLSKSITGSVSGLYSGAANIIKSAPKAISTILHRETPTAGPDKPPIRPAYIYTTNTFPGVQVTI
jgi:hypothetical protein